MFLNSLTIHIQNCLNDTLKQLLEIYSDINVTYICVIINPEIITSKNLA